MMTQERSALERAEERKALLSRMAADTVELRDILSWQRPHDTEAEMAFVNLYVDDMFSHPNVSASDVDGFGNRWFVVNRPEGWEGPNVLWSCHVDSMASKGGRQQVSFRADGKTLELTKGKPGRCLGADDGAGVWLLKEMIRAGVPGTFVFHRGEECGRLGSRHVRDKEAHRLGGFGACVAFDRRGTRSIVTHQMGERGVSKAFSASLAEALNDASGGRLDLEDDSSGAYTDSYTYFDYIPECTNVSVGYEHEHGPRETLDMLHVWNLRNALVSASYAGIAVERDPDAGPVYDSWDDDRGYTMGSPYGGGWNLDGVGYSRKRPTLYKSPAQLSAEAFERSWKGTKGTFAGGGVEGSYPQEEEETLFQHDYNDAALLLVLCKEYPEEAAEIMSELGVSVDDFVDKLGSEKVAAMVGT